MTTLRGFETLARFFNTHTSSPPEFPPGKLAQMQWTKIQKVMKWVGKRIAACAAARDED
jgi:hypothetical protein